MSEREAPNLPPRILGIDPSIVSTGIALDGALHTINPRNAGDARLVEIQDQLATYAGGADYAVLEDLPKHAHSAGLLGMVQGIIRTTLLRAGVPYATVPPATLKMFATCNGRADKTEMADAWQNWSGTTERQPDKVDAAWLREAGHQLFTTGHGLPMPPGYVQALHAAKMPHGFTNPVSAPDRTRPKRKRTRR